MKHPVVPIYPQWLLEKLKAQEWERARLAAYHANSA